MYFNPKNESIRCRKSADAIVMAKLMHVFYDPILELKPIHFTKLLMQNVMARYPSMQG